MKNLCSRIKRLTLLSLVITFILILFPAGTVSANADSVATSKATVTRSKTEEEWLAEIENLPIDLADPYGVKYYYYRQLEDIGKVFYWEFVNAPLCDEFIIEVTELSRYNADELQRIIRYVRSALKADVQPSSYIWSMSTPLFPYQDELYSECFYRNETVTDYILEKASSRIETIKESINPNADRYTKLHALLSIIGSEMYYDANYAFAGQRQGLFNDTALGPLVMNVAVCEGFCEAFKVLCDALDVPCITIGNAGHGWNNIMMEDNKWYVIDVTNIVFGSNMKDSAPSFWFEVDPSYMMLLGSDSSGYAQDARYHYSEPYMIYDPGSGMEVFPELAQTQYIYRGELNSAFVDGAPTFQEPIGRFQYRVNEDGETCTIISYEGIQSGDLIIPESLDGYSVTHIGDGAFYLCEGFTGNLVIPNSVVEIEQGAFIGCSALNGSLLMSQNCSLIGNYAFARCEKLHSDGEFLQNVTTLGRGVFYFCHEFSGTFYLPNDIEWDSSMIENTGFSAIEVCLDNKDYQSVDGVLYSKDGSHLVSCPCAKSGTLSIIEGVLYIDDWALYRCREMSGVLILPEGLCYIGTGAFQDCGFTGELHIPDSVTQICAQAFGWDHFSGQLRLPSGLIEIGDNAFCFCNFTGSLEIPESVARIGQFAFMQNQFTGNLDLSDREIEIGYYAFDGSAFDFFKCNCCQTIERDKIVPSCGAAGKISYYCENCAGGYTETLSNDGIEHTPGEAAQEHELAPTCDNDGSYEEVVYCTVCGGELSRQNKTVSSLGHDWDTPTYEWSADNKTVTATRVCTRNPDHIKTETVNTSSAVKTAATCEGMGTTTYTAVFNNEAFTAQTKDVEDIPALGHDWDTPTYEWSADNKTVTATHSCNNDSSHIETETVNTTSAVKTAATCEAKGTTTYTATFSNPAFATQPRDVEDIPALGHDWGEWGLTTVPTETAAGAESRTCKTDASHTETRTVWAIVLRTDEHGTVSASADYAAAGTELRVNAVPAEGWMFDGWNVLTEGLAVTDGEFPMPEAPVILEARWSKIPSAILSVENVLADGSPVCQAVIRCGTGETLTVFAARYDADGRFLSVETMALQAGENTFTVLRQGAAQIRFFVLNSVTWAPACEAAYAPDLRG